ncbi:MAG: ATP-dependent DNA helicase RecG, partial [Rikenellaceae bacterium]
MGNIFDTELKFLPTVGEKRFQLMRNELKITTYGDLLRLYPYRYLDRTKIYTINEITEQTTTFIQIKARVYNVEVIGSGRSARLDVMVQDATGRAKLIWFSGVEWALKRIEVGREYIIFGKPNFFNGFISFAHPETDVPMSAEALAKMSVYGIYPSTEKINKIGGTKFISSLIRILWKTVEAHIHETLPDYLIKQQGL